MLLSYVLCLYTRAAACRSVSRTFFFSLFWRTKKSIGDTPWKACFSHFFGSKLFLMLSSGALYANSGRSCSFGPACALGAIPVLASGALELVLAWAVLRRDGSSSLGCCCCCCCDSLARLFTCSSRGSWAVAVLPLPFWLSPVLPPPPPPPLPAGLASLSMSLPCICSRNFQAGTLIVHPSTAPGASVLVDVAVFTASQSA
mmetsp:Transcript_17879/g.50687  ORF Transcript_17879/g.50687 Transcript_17879/m.50687 type:complete len:201 (-) Transcript_17879:129-731(-)